MKYTFAFLLLLVTPVLAEEVTVKQPAMLKADRNLVSLKPGTVVELISRDGSDVTIKYNNLTGKIPASKLEEPEASASDRKADATAPSRPAPAAKAKNEKPAKKSAPAAPANPPQTNYGKAVQKAKESVEAHNKNR